MMNNRATVLEKTSSQISFQVDDVEIAPELLSVTNAKAYLQASSGDRSLIAFSHKDDFSVVAQAGNHPLATAIHLAFSQHRPLLLSPDIIWLTIAQGFANHINNNAEALRSKFVSHQDKIDLTVHALIPSSSEEWQSIISQWGLLIREHIDPKLYQLMLCDFTTTTETISTASKVVMMNAFRQYFDYRLMAICGIPSITLLGTVDDWQIIRDRVKALAHYDLEWWTNRLLPICERFVATAQGNPNQEFWQRIYKPEEIYGGDVITGWLADLFPYLKDPISHKPIRKNPILAISHEEITVNDGISLQRLPVGLSETTFTLEANNKEKKLELLGGFIGVTQDNDKCLQPEIGWAIREPDRLSQLITVLADGQTTELKADWSKLVFPTEVPKEIFPLAEKFMGLTLYSQTDSSWYFQAPEEYKIIKYAKYNKYFNSFIQLQDGRYIAFTFVNRCIGKWHEPNYRKWRETWIIVAQTEVTKVLSSDKSRRRNRGTLIPEGARTIAIGIEQFLERIVKSKGKYYFDDPNFVPDVSLDVLEE